MAKQVIQPNPFTRLQHPDPATNRIVQDIYDKLQQAQAQLIKLQAAIPSS